MAEGLRLERHGDGVVRATIDRGDENLLTGQTCAELAAWLREPPSDAHVLVLAPAGPNFCLGRERRATTVERLREEVGALVGLNRALRATRVVTVAQVSGGAAGYGVGLAALSDVTVAAPSARFWFPEVDMDLAPTVVLAWLPRLVGGKQAFRLTATGRKISAAEAAEIGLVTVVAPADDALERTVQEEVADLRAGLRTAEADWDAPGRSVRGPRSSERQRRQRPQGRSAAPEHVNRSQEGPPGPTAREVHRQKVHSEIKAFLRGSVDLTEDQAYDLAVEKLILGSMGRRN